MFTRSRRFASSSSSEKKPSVSENSTSNKNVAAVKTRLTKKRPALADVTNNRNASLVKTSLAAPYKPMVPCASKTAKTKKDSIASSQKNVMSENILQPSSRIRSSGFLVSKEACSTKASQIKTGVKAFIAPSNDGAVCPDFKSVVCSPRWMDIYPSNSFSGSASLDESMSTSDSLMTPEFEYIRNDDVVSIKSIENKTCNILNISDSSKMGGRIHDIDTILKSRANEFVDIDRNTKDPQFCASFAHEIYENLRVSEKFKRPSMDYMEKIQKKINASMRAMLIDWLVEVADEYRLLPDTLFLAVNYLDRYLSGKAMNTQQLQLLGVTCMMIAAKYEEICAPKVEEFCYVTDNTYSKEQVLEMESSVLNFLKFEMTAPTIRCFLRRFITVAQQTCEIPLMQLEYLADYVADLSLLEYDMLKYTPSLIAASATFLAKYILLSTKNPWNSMLRHYTGYQASELRECVEGLHLLYRNGYHSSPSITAIREKYSQHKFKFAAKKCCPPSIPVEVFHN
ncbi:putative cyclin [Medicago truncatula]|uniref:B-like cyclin n=1 Tax=Medicago truncatula TaxID=3880 RepID=A0A072V0K7_MEDTR|nr:cyclin-A1-4 [Medicago truncatula]KEH35322.1 carboxy-terminal domain cyclin [Medicago truncatula]RHN69464.1 putative cyclin [Medicago truncatula]